MTTLKAKPAPSPEMVQEPATLDTDTLVADVTSLDIPANSIDAYRQERDVLITGKLSAIGDDTVEGSLKWNLFHYSNTEAAAGQESAKGEVFKVNIVTALFKLRTSRITDKQGNSLVAMSGNEAKAYLGKYLGFKETSQGKVSKTLAPAGNAIDKRATRLVRAWEAVDAHRRGHPEQAPDYFAKCQPDDLAGVLSLVEGGASPWTAYDTLGEIAKEANDKAYWFNNAKRIDTMTAEIATAPESVLQSIRDNNAHKVALADLVDSLRKAIDY